MHFITPISFINASELFITCILPKTAIKMIRLPSNHFELCICLIYLSDICKCEFMYKSIALFYCIDQEGACVFCLHNYKLHLAFNSP